MLGLFVSLLGFASEPTNKMFQSKPQEHSLIPLYTRSLPQYISVDEI